MCGIAGILSVLPVEEVRLTAARMTAALQHRGPDAGGLELVNGARTVALGHRRLSIIDLSPAGAQPMLSSSGRFLISFNGEIYNFAELRGELQSAGFRFRGGSDTEVLLAAVEQWGFKGALERSAGMFALALWDKKEKKLFLARDRMGEKPLYFGKAGRDFVFGSELKALREHPAFQKTVDPAALQLFLTLGYIPAPLTIFAGAQKLPPGHLLEVAEDGTYSEARPYWDLAQVARAGLANPLPSLEAEAAIENALRLTLRQQLVSDVPLGCFLSGGIDSSLIASMLQEELGAKKLRTFSIGFGDGGFDESRYARAVSEAIGTEHTELRATAAQARELVPALPHLFDEPFADVSQLPTLLLARLARPFVTVALSGDGGDEVFAGYNRYLFLEKARRIPGFAAPLFRSASSLAGLSSFRALENAIGLPQIDEKLRKLGNVASAGSEAAAYWALAAQGVHEPLHYLPVERAAAGFQGVPGLQLRDQLLYLPDDVLVKVDRSAMASSLETRAPFLDHRLVELAWRLPASLRTGGGAGKLMLRKLLRKRVSPELWERPKAGFTPPVGDWLRGGLRDWAEELLSERSLHSTGLPGAALVRSEWARVSSAGGNGALRLWPALMAQAWLKSEL